MIEREYAVFVVDRGKRPRKVDVPLLAGKPLPSTIEVEGKTYYWTTADVSARTLTFCEFKPEPQRWVS